MAQVPLVSPLYNSPLTAAGAINAAGLVYTYSAGTTTPKTTYTDSGGGTPNANPVVLDASGQAAIWGSGSYKFVVKTSAGVTITTDDNYASFGTGAANTVTDSTFLIADNSDATKLAAFQCSGITTGTTVTMTVPNLGNGTLALSDAAQSFSLGQRTSTTALTSTAASIAVNLALNNDFSHTFTENTTLANPTNIVVGQSGAFRLTQHASSPKTLAYGSYYKFPGGTVPTVTATNSAIDTLYYSVRSSTQIECNLVKGFA